MLAQKEHYTLQNLNFTPWLLGLLAACGGTQTLQETFESQLRADGLTDFSILALVEQADHGLVVHTAWNKERADRQFAPAIYYYEKDGGSWSQASGTACTDRGVARLGLMGHGHLLCGVLREGMDFASVKVGETDTHLVALGNGQTLFYTVSDHADAKVTGVRADGSRVDL